MENIVEELTSELKKINVELHSEIKVCHETDFYRISFTHTADN
ncbi:MAG: hypothetical protein Q8Q47_08465 [Ignavibacteriaceae bacterium]|nr:hypothetical protein [Ignavibacteriaceae bacterium]